MEVTEIRPVKDAQDFETLAQYVEAGMDQNGIHGCHPKISQDTSQPAMEGSRHSALYVQEKIWGHCL